MKQKQANTQEPTTEDVLKALAEADCNPRKVGRGYQALCPCHNDHHPSLSITEDAGKVLVHCHAGCSQERVWSWVLEQVKHKPNRNGKQNRNGTNRKRTRNRTPQGLTLQEFAEAFHLDSELLQDLGVHDSEYQGHPAVGFTYNDSDGNHAYIRHRIALEGDKFRQPTGVSPILYGLWRVKLFKQQGTLWLVEGESDTLVLWQANLLAVGIPGASSWKAEWWNAIGTDWTRVYLWCEDSAGTKLIQAILETAPPELIGRIRIVLSPALSGMGEPKDPADLWRANPDSEAFRQALQGLEQLTVEAFRERFLPTQAVVQIAEEPLIIQLSEAGLAESIANEYRNRYRYRSRLKCWLKWDGRRWRETEPETVKESLLESVKARLKQAVNERNADAIKFLTRYLKDSSLNALRSLLETLLYVETINPHPYRINCLNGTLDLRTGELKPHNPNDLITNLAPVEYKHETAVKWIAHLERCLPDPDIRRTVQRGLGLALAGVHLDEVFPIFYGHGANGKTTTIEVLRGVLGDYACIAPPHLLHEGDRHPTEIANLEGKRLVFLPEMGGKALNTERLKMLTGGETVKARRLYSDFYEIPKSWTLIGITNTKPRIPEQDTGTWRRIRLIPWTVQIPPHERRPQAEVIAELLAEGGAILAWLYQGYLNALQYPEWEAQVVKQATDLYRLEEDPFGDFTAERLIFEPHARTPARELYQAYLDWCEINKVKPQSQQAFGRYLASQGHESIRLTNGVKGWTGIRLKQ